MENTWNWRISFKINKFLQINKNRILQPDFSSTWQEQADENIVLEEEIICKQLY